MVTLQAHCADATLKSATDLADAFLALPEDKRDWKPASTSRSPADLLAECAVLGEYIPSLLRGEPFSQDAMNEYRGKHQQAVVAGNDILVARLQATAETIAAALRAVPDEMLDVKVPMPWGEQTVAEIVAYPPWNQAYHLGQVNYIASLVGELK